MRKRTIAGNWKMNKNLGEAVELAKSLKEHTAKVKGDVDVIICPPFTNLTAISNVIKDTHIGLGAQNMHWQEKGAFTGEISGDMLKSVGCDYVIVGHSERRQYFGETDETVNLKIRQAIDCGLNPIVCIGETLEERQDDATEDVLDAQLKNGLKDLSRKNMEQVIIAYEPVWAIGTGEVATPEQAQDAHAFIRNFLTEGYDQQLADNLCILYGGSMKPKNAADLLAKPDVDGGLIGGASLDAESFMGIILS
jgi:triosephosphate isomerase